MSYSEGNRQEATGNSRYFPVFLDLGGQRCVVIGRTEAAAAKARQLAEAGATVSRIAPEHYRHGDLIGARLAVDTGEDAQVTRRVRREADELGVLLNVMDKPEQCDFIAPAIAKHGPLQVAVSTSGESPYLAAALRDRIQEELGPEWGQFVALVGDVRRDLRAQGVPAGRQRIAYELLLDSNIPELLKEGALAAARRQAEALLRRALSERQTVEAGSRWL